MARSDYDTRWEVVVAFMAVAAICAMILLGGCRNRSLSNPEQEDAPPGLECKDGVCTVPPRK